jgi:hypothetical protein
MLLVFACSCAHLDDDKLLGVGSSEFKNIFGFFVGTSLDPLTIDLERYFIKTHSFDFGPRLDRYLPLHVDYLPFRFLLGKLCKLYSFTFLIFFV